MYYRAVAMKTFNRPLIAIVFPFSIQSQTLATIPLCVQLNILPNSAMYETGWLSQNGCQSELVCSHENVQ